MRRIFEFAEFIASGWRLANGDATMPSSNGVMDEALYRTRAKVPDRFKGLLTFGTTRVGFRCYELPDILYAAQANLLMSAASPSFLATNVLIDESVAMVLLRRRDLNLQEATSFAKELWEQALHIQKIDAAAA